MKTFFAWNWGLYAKKIVRFVIFLCAVQLLRSLVIYRLWAWLQPSVGSHLWYWMDMAAFTIVGAAALITFRPSAASLGLRLEGASRLERVASLGGIIFLLGMVISSYLIAPSLLLVNVSTVIFLPLFEELLFRGFGWGQLERAGMPPWLNWLTVSLLFAVWHFGYLDIYLLKMAPMWPNLDWGEFFLMKFLTTFLIGLVVGLPRWRTGRMYGSLALHMLINLFGP